MSAISLHIASGTDPRPLHAWRTEHAALLAQANYTYFEPAPGTGLVDRYKSMSVHPLLRPGGIDFLPQDLPLDELRAFMQTGAWHAVASAGRTRWFRWQETPFVGSRPLAGVERRQLQIHGWGDRASRFSLTADAVPAGPWRVVEYRRDGHTCAWTIRKD